MSNEARSELYRRQDLRSLLSWSVRGHEIVEPIKDDGAYDYPQVSELVGKDNVKSVLEELAQHGLYKKEVYDTRPSCPRCGSYTTLDTRYACPYCQGYLLRKGIIIEHYKCGNVDFSENYARGLELVCPKCNRALQIVGSDYRRIENMFQCLTCGKHFSIPSSKHECRRCHIEFDYREVQLTNIFRYRFNEAFRSEVMANCLFDLPIIDLFKESGYEVQAAKSLKGMSGIEHNFDIVATKEQKTIVLSIVSGLGEVGSDAVINFFAKKFDVSPYASVLVVLPKASSEATKLAGLYGIEIVEGDNIEEIISQLKTRFSGHQARFTFSGT